METCTFTFRIILHTSLEKRPLVSKCGLVSFSCLLCFVRCVLICLFTNYIAGEKYKMSSMSKFIIFIKQYPKAPVWFNFYNNIFTTHYSSFMLQRCLEILENLQQNSYTMVCSFLMIMRLNIRSFPRKR